MQKDTERWMELARMAAVEQDPKKLLALVTEINELLDKKTRRLAGLPVPPQSDVPKP